MKSAGTGNIINSKGLSIFNPLVGVESAVSANYGGFLVRGNLISFELVEVNGYRDW